jgi:hypothetical protein
MRKKRVAHFATIKVCGSAVADCLQNAGAQTLMARVSADFTAAVLDHGLSDGDTSEVCETLTGCSIPFVVYSGYSKLDGPCSEGELVSKPARRPGKATSSFGSATRASANLGQPALTNIETRFYFNANDIMQRIPGSVTRSVALPDVPCVQAD